MWQLAQGRCRDRVKGDIRGDAGAGDVRKHGSKRQGAGIKSINKAKAIQRNVREEANEGSEFSEGAGRATRSANLKEDVAAGESGPHKARKRVRGSLHGTDTREEDQKMTRGKGACCKGRSRGGRPRPDEDVGGRRGSETGADGNDGLNVSS